MLNNYLFLISSIIIPKDVSFIARDSFENCNILTINGYIGTYAETYAKENDFDFLLLMTNFSQATLTKTVL